MNIQQLIGAILVILVIGFVGVYSGKAVNTSNDFTTAGGKGNCFLVAGIALATLIGGATTVGTTQTAFNYGVAGMWYTLGSAVAFLLVAYVLTPIIRKSNNLTLGGIISEEFGASSELIASSVLLISMVISLASQMVSSCAVLKTMFPNLYDFNALVICFLLTVLCVLFGGNLSAGKAGQLKTLLIILVIITCGIYIVYSFGFDCINANIDINSYYNLFTRGTGYELGNGIATALGVCCSQANMNAVLSAKDTKTAKTGMILCAISMPIIGLGSTIIGIFMKSTNPNILAASAFSSFLINYLPNIVSGIAVGALFTTLILSASGTALGCSTVLVKSIIKRIRKDKYNRNNELYYLRISMLIVLLISTLAGSGIFGDSVLNFAFLSMSLRSVTLIIPFIFAIFFKGKADKTWIVLSEILCPLSVIFFGLTNVVQIDELYIGLFISIVCTIIGILKNRKQQKTI